MPDLYVPATAEKRRERDAKRDGGADDLVIVGDDELARFDAETGKLVPVSTETTQVEELAPRAARSYVRGARMADGKIPVTFENGPLAGKTYGLKPGTRQVSMPYIVNANERALAHLAGEVVPLPVVVHVPYRKRPGFTSEGAQRFVLDQKRR